ncbi:hypothetical protein RRG08_063965 [Elysia crispata]|uniref:Uncharacterized protein n=1 Tax=Elysia crispata TaxID=231223 RepID=A0AAE0YES7_9GAST|nr:hypothetical protein RRG08_063965 [Elysia crispata]
MLLLKDLHKHYYPSPAAPAPAPPPITNTATSEKCAGIRVRFVSQWLAGKNLTPTRKRARQNKQSPLCSALLNQLSYDLARLVCRRQVFAAALELYLNVWRVLRGLIVACLQLLSALTA